MGDEERPTNRNDPDIFSRAFAKVMDDYRAQAVEEIKATAESPLFRMMAEECRARWEALPWWEKLRRRGASKVYRARMSVASWIAGFDVEDRY